MASNCHTDDFLPLLDAAFVERARISCKGHLPPWSTCRRLTGSS